MIDVNKIKNDFAIYDKEKDLVYLDSAASSLTPKCVVDEIVKYYNELGGVNVNRGVYKLSYEATTLYENSREVVAKFINASKSEIVFTKGASASLNLVAASYGLANLKEGDEVVVSELEHHSSLLPWQNVCKKTKSKLVYIPLIDGKITVEGFKKVLSNKTAVVALTHVSNVLGYTTPIEEIIKLARNVNAIVSVDGAQSIPHMNIDVKSIDCDFFSFSAHKMCGPSGVGVLYGKKELLKNMSPIEYGGDMNDNVEKFEVSYKDAPYKFETGTPNIAGIIGLSKACEYLSNIGMDKIYRHENELYRYAINLLSNIEGVEVYNKNGNTGVIAFNINGTHPHDAASSFDEDNICLRAGHHCAQLVTKYFSCMSTLRASFYFYNTKDDVLKFVKGVEKAKNFFALF